MIIGDMLNFRLPLSQIPLQDKAQPDKAQPKPKDPEIKNSLKELFEKGPDVSEFISLHRRADADRDGKLTAAELRDYTRTLREQSNFLEAKQFFTSLTTDEEETLKQLNRDLKNADTMDQKFGVFDQDGNKSITPQEIYQVAEKDGDPYSISWFDLIDFGSLKEKLNQLRSAPRQIEPRPHVPANPRSSDAPIPPAERHEQSLPTRPLGPANRPSEPPAEPAPLPQAPPPTPVKGKDTQPPVEPSEPPAEPAPLPQAPPPTPVKGKDTQPPADQDLPPTVLPTPLPPEPPVNPAKGWFV